MLLGPYFKKLVAAIAVTVLLTFSVYGERIYNLGGSVNAVLALDDNPQVSSLRFVELRQSTLVPVFGFYPSLTLDSIGPNSDLQIQYSFGLNKVRSSLNLDHQTHVFELGLKSDLNERWKMEFSDEFLKAPDFDAFNVVNGVITTPAGYLNLDVETIAIRRNSLANTAALGFDYKVNPRSGLSFGVAHHIRNFEEDPRFRGKISDLNRISADFGYNRLLSERASWSVKYRLAQHEFKSFDSFRSHEVEAGLSYHWKPTVSLQASAGPSYTTDLDRGISDTGYDAALSLSKSFPSDTVSLTLEHRNGSSTGVGTVSKTQIYSLGYTHRFLRFLVLDSTFAYYESSRQLENPISMNGRFASAVVRYFLGRDWEFSAGAIYRDQKGDEWLNIERTRIFISIRYLIPTLARF